MLVIFDKFFDVPKFVEEILNKLYLFFGVGHLQFMLLGLHYLDLHLLLDSIIDVFKHLSYKLNRLGIQGL